jgi:dTDP-4-dehydrorhamnose reductase
MTDDKIIDIVPENENVENEEATYEPNDRIKVLVLGKGYIGTTLSNFLSIDNNNIEVHSVSRDQLNYLDRNDLSQFFANYEAEGISFDHVVNCVGYAGETNIDDAIDNQELAYILNVVFPTILGSVAQDFEIPSVINIGSGCIYNGDSENEAGFTETDIPNFGLSNSDSSWYSKTKHAAELSVSSSFNNSYTLRIRMPFSEVPSEKGNRNLFDKLLKYKTLLNAKNSATYLYDLHNTIYNIIISNEIPYGIYNVTSDGTFDSSMFLDIIREKKEALKEAGIIENESELDEVSLVDLEEFEGKDLTKEKRSVTTLDNSLIKETLAIEYANVSDRDFLSKIIDDYIQNSKQ